MDVTALRDDLPEMTQAAVAGMRSLSAVLGQGGPRSSRFAVKLCNSAGVFPQFDIGTVGHLLGALLRCVVVDAFEVDSSDVLAVTSDKIRAIV